SRLHTPSLACPSGSFNPDFTPCGPLGPRRGAPLNTYVFDAPVGTHLGVELAGVGPQAADVVAPLGRALGRIPATERFARGLDHDGAVQARPVLIRRGEGAHIVRHDALARLDAAVGLVD